MKIPQTTSCRFLLYGTLLAVLADPSFAYIQQPRIDQSTPRSSAKIKPPSVTAAAGPVIPGLRQNAIPQGIAFAPSQKAILISHYFENAPSCISVVNASTGKMVSCVTLQDSSGQPHRGHVGGVATLGDSLFVASDERVFHYKLADFLARNSAPAVSATASHKCETKASFCTATPSLLFVGEFAYGKKYPTESSHHLKDRKGVRKYAWVCGYDGSDPLGTPTCVLSVRQRVQGMCVSGDRVYLSISYGRANRSLIVVYRNPIGKEAHRMVALGNGDLVPLWFLDGNNYIGEIDFPPMSEGLVMIGNQLAVLSESGANKYQFGGKGPVDRVLLLDVSQFKPFSKGLRR